MEPRVLAYDARGDGDPIVLVPGGLTGWLSWIPHQERLADRYQCIRVQPIHNELGSAGVPGDPDYSSQTEREALRLTLDALALPSVHLAGWSGGGTAALEFAMEYPMRVRSLTLIEPGAHWVLEQIGERVAEVQKAYAAIHAWAGRELSEQDLADFLVVAGLSPSVEAARSDPGWDRWFAHRAALSWQSERLDHPARSVAELALVGCPVLLVKGTDSTELDRRLVDVLGERLRDATVIELEGDHASHIESIDAFLAAFERHLRTVPR
jgi:pimeloyl-ACP methyl ester carboxylesterase